MCGQVESSLTRVGGRQGGTCTHVRYTAMLSMFYTVHNTGMLLQLPLTCMAATNCSRLTVASSLSDALRRASLVAAAWPCCSSCQCACVARQEHRVCRGHVNCARYSSPPVSLTVSSDPRVLGSGGACTRLTPLWCCLTTFHFYLRTCHPTSAAIGCTTASRLHARCPAHLGGLGPEQLHEGALELVTGKQRAIG